MADWKMKLASTVLLLELCICVCSAGTALENQAWWARKTKLTIQKGCAGTCCTGKNSTCYGTGLQMGGKTSFQGKCFCDESCLDMEDCCEDYSLQCQAVDCEVGEWETYGACSKPCGLGSKTRRRQVIQEPRNGGQECPALKENTVCMGKRCKSQRHLGSRGRSDLDTRVTSDNMQLKPVSTLFVNIAIFLSLCLFFIGRICRSKIQQLDDHVATTARIMPAKYAQYRGYVKYNPHLDIRKNLFYRYYAQRAVSRKGYCATYEITSARLSCSRNAAPWSRVLGKGAQICVECQPKAMGGDHSTTCKGHGSMQRDTFWTAVNAHGCHGWWRRVTDLQECSCGDKQSLGFIFV